MARIVLTKLLSLAITLLVSSFLVFGSLYLVPGDPLRFLLNGRAPSPEAVEMVTVQYGLDQPFFVRYLNWLGGLLHGDFGRSFQFRDDVLTLVMSRLPTTVGLLVYAAIVIVVVGLVAGITASLYRGRTLDRAILVTLSGFAAIPTFVAAIALVALFSVQLGWFPVFGAGEGLLDTIYHLTLPAIALALTFVAMVGRITRSSMLEQLDREHVEVAESRGLGRASVIRRHVFRNALGPISTVSGVLVAGLLVSGAIVEQSFGLSGIGSLLVASVDRMDFPVVQAIVLLIVAAFVLVNTAIGLLQPLIDPRSAAKESAR
jgi:peptide/nickel transport system permease protein